MDGVQTAAVAAHSPSVLMLVGFVVRFSTRTLILEPLWRCKPATTRIYFRAMPFITAEFATQELNRNLMAAEDVASRAMEQALRVSQVHEWDAMTREDQDMRYLMVWEANLRKESRMLDGALERAHTRAETELHKDLFLQEQFRQQARAETRLEEELSKMEHEQWEGEGYRTPLMTKRNRKVVFKLAFDDACTEYINAAVDSALRDHHMDFLAQRNTVCVTDAIQKHYHDIVDHWVREVVQEVSFVLV